MLPNIKGMPLSELDTSGNVKHNFEKEELPRRSTSPGLHMGLSLLLDVQENEYYCTGTRSTGFKGLLHMPISQPRIYEHGFAIAPGMIPEIICDLLDSVGREVPLPHR